MISEIAENKLNRVLSMLESIDITKDINGKKIICDILATVEPQEIIDFVGMADMPKISFLLMLKSNDYPLTIPIDNDLMLRNSDVNFANMSYLAIFFHFLSFENGILKIEGHMSLPLTGKNVKLAAKINGAISYIETEDKGFNLKIGSNVYEKRPYFQIEVPIVGEETSIQFFNEVDGRLCRYGRINTYRFCPVSDEIEKQFFYKEGYIFKIESELLSCRKASEKEAMEAENQYIEAVRKQFPGDYSFVAELRNSYYLSRKKKKRIWLFIDRPDRADDNAEVLFEYVQGLEGIESFFIIDESSKDFLRLKTIGKVVPLFSKEHYQLVLQAEYIISSQCNGVIENPFLEKAKFFRDLYHNGKIIFLQHGVIKDDMSITLNRFNTNFYAFITSTKAEYKSILEYPYYYSEKEVWLTGLPRFDKLYETNGKDVLIMPSWRAEFMSLEYSKDKGYFEWKLLPEFEKTIFCKKYVSLLNDRFFQFICKCFGYKVKFVIHPILRSEFEKRYPSLKKFFVDESTSYRDLFAKGSLLITDYSSVAFDFSYLRKPIIYFQFDKETFFKNHTYRKGYFDYKKDSFGKVCKYRSKLICELFKIILFKCKISKKQVNRRNELWADSDNCCEKIVDRLLGI